MRIKGLFGAVATMVMVLGLSGVSGAAPAANSPVGGTGAHPHHVHTGNGGCVQIDSVLFEPASRGLHNGANASGGHERGPFHGPCE